MSHNRAAIDAVLDMLGAVPERLELTPSSSELLQAARWARTHDPSPAFRGLLLDALRFLGVDDADDRL